MRAWAVVLAIRWLSLLQTGALQDAVYGAICGMHLPLVGDVEPEPLHLSMNPALGVSGYQNQTSNPIWRRFHSF